VVREANRGQVVEASYQETAMPPDFILPSAGPQTVAPGISAARRSDEPGEPGSTGAHAAYLSRIAVRSLSRIVIVPVHEIVRLEAEDNYVRIWADRPYLHKETLTGLCAKLDPAEFLRVHRSHAVNLRLVRELHPLLHGEFRIVLANGTEITSGRSFRAAIQRAFGLTRGDVDS
jgi:DNA-binding LytR/AlgR family response regulator